MQDISLPFQNWVQLKKVQPQDLRFLALLSNEAQRQRFAQLTDEYFKSSPSFSEGLQTLETVVDLILMNRADQVPAFSISENWRYQLSQIRNPITATNDEVRKTAIEQLSWPQGSKVKVERRGDRHGVEVKFFVSTASDLTKVIASLERVKNDFPV